MAARLRLVPWARPEAPSISVVVPARDEERSLAACLASICAQEPTLGGVEVVVVENGSHDRTRAIADEFARTDPRVRVVVSRAANQAAAMNDGIAAAGGDVVARVDAHSRLAPDYLRQVVAALRRHARATGVGGPFLPAGTTVVERAIGRARASALGVGGGYGADRRRDDHRVPSVQCGAYWRDALVDAGLFDPAMLYGEDEELNWRMVRDGGEIWLCPRLEQPYRPRSSLRALLRQYWNYGRGRVRVLRKHPEFLRARHLIPSAFLVALAGATIVAIVVPRGAIALAGLAGAYGGALAVAAWTARPAPRAELALVPPAVACLHAGYGAGMLFEALRGFVPRRAGRRSPCPA
jgi:glycosyltransferase involved in cell wall biosynthesis